MDGAQYAREVLGLPPALVEGSDDILALILGGEALSERLSAEIKLLCGLRTRTRNITVLRAILDALLVDLMDEPTYPKDGP